ncbi:MAG: DUF2298 domain-containing protein [Archaeoglobales archaeon]|nr:DUF2298 domain-containing protein [Archaeoglobales archaeon]
MSFFYAIVFYFLSLLITLPFLKFLKFSVARFTSLFLLTLTSFFLGHLIAFKVVFYAILILTILLLAYLIYSKYRLTLDKSETIFACVFFFFIFLRFLNPSIFDAEKFMDMAFMNSILKSPSLPPNDPFFASEKLNCYYYFGHMLGAGIILLSFAPPEIGYNIAVAAIPAYTALLVYGIFESNRKIALIAMIFVAFSGNAYSFVDLLHRPFSGGLDFLYYWNSTRMIEGTINEFPYFSFIHADLHAHVFAIPMKIFFVSLLLLNEKRIRVLLPLTLFAIFATNSWDYPIMLLLSIVYALSIRDKDILVYSLVSLPLVAFYYTTMNLPKTEIVFSVDKSALLEFLGYSATLLILAYLVYLISDKKPLFYSIPIALPFYLLSPILPVLIPLLVCSAYGVYKKDRASALVLTAMICFILPEFVAIDSRLNTVFKFYLCAWILLAIGAVMKLKIEDLRREAKLIVAVLLIASLVYPLVATPLRYNYSFAEFTLDGMSFTKRYGEYEAIQWLKEKDGAIIEEGCTHGYYCAYQYGGRVAVFTGNPTVVAWTGHEFQWRRNYSAIAERAGDVREFYTSKDCNEMTRILEKYNVSYVFFGYEERRLFGSELAIEKCFEKVFESGNAKIFSALRKD